MVAGCLIFRSDDIRVNEIVAYKKQRFRGVGRECIREAVAEVEARTMAALAIFPVGRSRSFYMFGGDGNRYYA
jgi:hypothetical protein